jgi:hypothetical protein
MNYTLIGVELRGHISKTVTLVVHGYTVSKVGSVRNLFPTLRLINGVSLVGV